jgi:hypothetical protein
MKEFMILIMLCSLPSAGLYRFGCGIGKTDHCRHHTLTGTERRHTGTERFLDVIILGLNERTLILSNRKDYKSEDGGTDGLLYMYQSEINFLYRVTRGDSSEHEAISNTNTFSVLKKSGTAELFDQMLDNNAAREAPWV